MIDRPRRAWIDRPLRPFRPPTRSVVVRDAGAIAAVIAVATVVVALLESTFVGLSDASPVYFVAVVIAGSLLGTWPAIATAFASFLVYDLLFTQPTFNLIVSDPRELLDLGLFLVLAVIVGRLSAIGRERAEEASSRAAESTALFAISRIIATEPDIEAAAPPVARRLVADGTLERVWIVRDRGGGPVVLADTRADEPLPISSFMTSLVRMPGDTPAKWVVAHEPGGRDAGPSGSGRAAGGGGGAVGPGVPVVRVRMEAEGVVVGAIKATLTGGAREPGRVTTRLLSLAADQLGLAIRRDDLRREATEAEIARRADALKSALLDAVSHDLRTPLASIRAAAGSLVDPDVALDEASARSTAAAIDVEADRLDRLVREVLDLSRVEAGSLRLDLEPLVLADAVGAVVDRLRPLLGDRPIRLAIPHELPPVRADAVLLDGLLTNLVENVARHAPAPGALEIAASSEGDRVHLTIDDGGPGLTPAARERLFAKFQPLPSTSQGSRPGLGLGLAIVRGMTEAMGGSVEAAPSPLGGLRIVVELPTAAPEPTEPHESRGEPIGSTTSPSSPATVLR